MSSAFLQAVRVIQNVEGDWIWDSSQKGRITREDERRGGRANHREPPAPAANDEAPRQFIGQLCRSDAMLFIDSCRKAEYSQAYICERKARARTSRLLYGSRHAATVLKPDTEA